jgi:hypothetical protein
MVSTPQTARTISGSSSSSPTRSVSVMPSAQTSRSTTAFTV